MGFSDTATYLRSNKPAAVRAALTPILARHGYRPTRSGQGTPVPSYTPLTETPALQFWMAKAADDLLRVYSSHPGIFGMHDGDYLPILQRLAAALDAEAFEIVVDDGDSIAVLETDGARSRLTGCHSYVFNEIYDRKGDLTVTPGEIYTFRGVQFPYESLEVDAKIIPELIGYDFAGGLDTAIEDFEQSKLGRRLPSYYHFDGEPAKAIKKNIYNYALEA